MKKRTQKKILTVIKITAVLYGVYLMGCNVYLKYQISNQKGFVQG